MSECLGTQTKDNTRFNRPLIESLGSGDSLLLFTAIFLLAVIPTSYPVGRRKTSKYSRISPTRLVDFLTADERVNRYNSVMDSPYLLSKSTETIHRVSNTKLANASESTTYHNGLPPPDDTPDTPKHEREKAEAFEGAAHGVVLPNEEDVVLGAPGCQKCEVLPEPLADLAGQLSVRFPYTPTLGRILNFLIDSAYQHQEKEGILTIRVEAGGLSPLLSEILDRMAFPEQRDTRAHFQPDGHLPQVNDLFETEALPDFAARVRSVWLIRLLREKRFYSVFQPILPCHSPPSASDAAAATEGRIIFAYECLLRGKGADGGIVSPTPMLDMARSAGLLFHLDLAARRSAILGIAKHGITRQHKVFINFTPNAIYTPRTCLDSTLRLIDEMGISRAQVVFEIIESERLPEMAHMQRLVGFFREEGFGVALDDVGAGFSSLSVLAALRPDYVKMDRSLVRDVDKNAGNSLVAGKLLEMVSDLGLYSIVEGIETKEEFAWARAHGADFVQGFLFAHPATPPPLVLL